MRSRVAAAAAMLVLAGFFAVAVAQMFAMRFASGSAYARGSSFRADPRGTRVLYEALARQPGLAVERNIEPLARLADRAASTTLVLAGFGTSDFEMTGPGVVESLTSFTVRGGRTVIACDGLSAWASFGTGAWSTSDTLSVRPPAEATTATLAERYGRGPFDDDWTTTGTHYGPHWDTLDRKWGFGLGRLAPANDSRDADRAEGFPDLPSRIKWHAGSYFRGLSPEWRAVYTCESRPVVVERPFGRGSIVLALDDYPLSNEAMRRERHASVAAWCVGRASRVVFDETHLGVARQWGAVALARHYGLDAFLVGLLVLAALFVWKNALPLVPPPPGPRGGAGEPAVIGRESSEALANMLRRHVAPRKLLALCIEEWHRTCARGYAQQQAGAAQRLDEVRRIVDQESAKLELERDPVAMYRAIHAALSRRS